ncbi:MAG: hypothetical protein HPY81_05765 [Firmicutes bacterium]|nr:hypothetical protein [Bacillota bacterium]
MYCEECKKRPATVHVTKIVNNKKTERHLCEYCAREQEQIGFGFEPSFSIQKLLASLLNYEPPTPEGISIAYPEPTKCENCGLTYSQFGQLGKVGCSECYQRFSEKLSPLLRRIHGSARHTGKIPKRTGGAIRLQKEIEHLRQQLQNAIQREEFEQAAQLRDQIRELEKKLP